MAISRSVVLALWLAACGDEEAVPDETGEITSDSIVSPGYFGPVAAKDTDFPALNVRGRVVEGSPYSTSALVSHQGRHSDGVDLAAPPRDVSDPSAWSTWLGDMIHVASAVYFQPTALEDHLTALRAASDAHMPELRSDILEQIASLLGHLGFDVTVEVAPTTHIATWTPERARWLDSVWAHAPTSARTDPDTHYQYPVPRALAAFPDRAARLYCAAREVARHQTTGSLGDQVLLPIDILGQHLDIGVFDPIAYVNRPENVLRTTPATNDGVNSFTVPLLLGATIWPIRGLLPPLPEIRYPLVVSSTDSEVLTKVRNEFVYEDQRCVTIGLFGFGTLCVPILRWDFRGIFKTLAHTDSMQWESRGLTSQATVPLFLAGPMVVKLLFGFDAAIGKQTETGASATTSHRDLVIDDRMMVLTPSPAGWPTTVANARKTDTSFPYYDGYWTSAQRVVVGDPSNEAFNVHTFDGSVDHLATSVDLSPTDPMRAAALANSDHHVAPVTELGVHAGVNGDIELGISVADFHFHADGTIQGTLGLGHDVRDAVTVENGIFGVPAPVSALTVTPTTYGDATFRVDAFVDVTISVFIGTLHAHFKIVHKDFDIAHFENRWSEDHRLRIGTASHVGDATLQPTVDSKIGDLSFPSFSQSVTACLADPTEVPPPPGACTPDTVPPQQPSTATCLATAADPQVDLCAHIPDAATDPCAHEKLAFLCSPVTKQQAFGGSYLIAHKMNYNPAGSVEQPDIAALARIADVCSAAALGTAPVDPSVLDAWFASSFNVLPCTDDATLLDPDSIISVGTGSVEGSRCH